MNRKSLGKQIQKYRERAGYSQEKLAEIIECADCQPKRTPVPYSTDSPRHN